MPDPTIKAAIHVVLDALIDAPCPDCNADIEISRTGGMHVVNIRHDDTCPTFRARETRRNQPK